MLCLNENLKCLIKQGLTPEMKSYVEKLSERYSEQLSEADKQICYTFNIS